MLQHPDSVGTDRLEGQQPPKCLGLILAPQLRDDQHWKFGVREARPAAHTQPTACFDEQCLLGTLLVGTSPKSAFARASRN